VEIAPHPSAGIGRARIEQGDVVIEDCGSGGAVGEIDVIHGDRGPGGIDDLDKRTAEGCHRESGFYHDFTDDQVVGRTGDSWKGSLEKKNAGKNQRCRNQQTE
jgi:hypothetical protein